MVKMKGRKLQLMMVKMKMTGKARALHLLKASWLFALLTRKL